MSPHFRLMDERALPPAEAMLMRSKLHWRCGMRKMEESKSFLIFPNCLMKPPLRFNVSCSPKENSSI